MKWSTITDKEGKVVGRVRTIDLDDPNTGFFDIFLEMFLNQDRKTGEAPEKGKEHQKEA